MNNRITDKTYKELLEAINLLSEEQADKVICFLEQLENEYTQDLSLQHPRKD